MKAVLKYQVEDWRACADESRWLWPLHYDEASLDKDVPLELDEEAYFHLAESGQMHVVTARAADGKLVGYCWAVVRRHLHYKSLLCAYFDAYFLHPAYRDGFNGIKLFQVTEETLVARGVKKMLNFTKLHNNKGPVFEYLGWKPAEITYGKRIGGE